MSSWRDPWTSARASIKGQYGQYEGGRLEDVPTPALVLDLDVMHSNISRMAATLSDRTARLRPHTKVQKSPDIAQLQLDAGAVGVTVANVWEAAAMAAAGVEDILLANEVVAPVAITAAASLSRLCRLTVCVDDLANVRHLAAAVGVDGDLSVLIELDVGMNRCGCRSLDAALELARTVDSTPGLHLAGIQAYEGHCMKPDRAVRVAMAEDSMQLAVAAKRLLQADGLPASALSAGGTGTYDITGLNPDVTELQAGSYIFMDRFHGSIVPEFEVSLTVLSTVLSRQDETVVLDAGRKAVGVDFAPPALLGQDCEPVSMAEEHGIFKTNGPASLRPRDRVDLVCGYAPTTVNLHQVIFGCRAGIVEEVFPVFPRGPGHHGFARSLELAETT